MKARGETDCLKAGLGGTLKQARRWTPFWKKYEHPRQSVNPWTCINKQGILQIKQKASLEGGSEQKETVHSDSWRAAHGIMVWKGDA